jgi:hypothetical protein
MKTLIYFSGWFLRFTEKKKITKKEESIEKMRESLLEFEYKVKLNELRYRMTSEKLHKLGFVHEEQGTIPFRLARSED